MKNKISKIFAGIFVATLVVGGNIVSAASVGYSATVPVYNDYESGWLDKSASTAQNTCTYIQRGKLVSWMECKSGLSSGVNATDKVTYGTTGTYSMPYYYGFSGHTEALLNISTSSSTFVTVSTNGRITT